LTKETGKIKVFIIDDHPLVREGLKRALDGRGNIKIAGDFDSGRAGIDAIPKEKPDVIILDVTMPDMSGIEAIKIIKKNSPATKVIALTMHDSKDIILEMIRLGASGYVLKDSPLTELQTAIDAVHNGQSYYSSKISGIISNEFTKKIQQSKTTFKEDELTPREKEVLICVVNGMSNKEIADKLFLSQRTVETHRFSIKKKLNIGSVAGLTKYAISKGLI